MPTQRRHVPVRGTLLLFVIVFATGFLRTGHAKEQPPLAAPVAACVAACRVC